MYSVGYLRYTFYARYPVMSVFVLAKRRLMVLDEQMGGGRRRRGKAPKMLYFDRSTWHGKKIIIKNKIKRRRRRCIGKEKKHARRRWLRAKRRLDVCARARVDLVSWHRTDHADLERFAYYYYMFMFIIIIVIIHVFLTFFSDYRQSWELIIILYNVEIVKLKRYWFSHKLLLILCYSVFLYRSNIIAHL